MINKLKLILIPVLTIILIACENNIEPGEETFTGFWNATETAQHFWLDDLGDSVSGFGQIGKLANSGYIQWIPVTINGIISGNEVVLNLTHEGISSMFEGTAENKNKLSGMWIVSGDSIELSFNKRIKE